MQFSPTIIIVKAYRRDGGVRKIIFGRPRLRLCPDFPYMEVRATDIRPPPPPPPYIFTDSFDDYSASFESKCLDEYTREQLTGEVREYWSGSGLIKGGSFSVSLEALDPINNYSKLTLEAYAGQLADPIDGQPGFYFGFSDYNASPSADYCYPTSRAIYALLINWGDEDKDTLSIYAWDEAGNLTSAGTSSSPVSRYGSKYWLYFEVVISERRAVAKFPYGESNEMMIELTDIPQAVFDSITDTRVCFGSRLYVYTGKSGEGDNRFDEVKVK